MAENTPTGWMLAIDFGTSNTAAAIRTGDANEVLELGPRSKTMPSGVIVDTGDGPRVGEMAERLRALHTADYVDNPKGLVGTTPQMFGGRPVQASEFVADIFREVRRIALDRKGQIPPTRLVLTHPSAWGGVKTQQLRRAAELAGFDRRTVILVEEPIAAAHHFKNDHEGRPVPVGSQVLVFDFGGGTLDLALVQRTENDGYEVMDVEAIEDLGGNNFDQALWDWTISHLGSKGGSDKVERIRSDSGRREAAALQDSVRRAKEDLSVRPATEIPVIVDGYDDAYRATVEEYEALIRPDVDRAVAKAVTLLARNDAGKVVRFYLTGGSSLTPLVARALEQATGIPPTRLDDPKTVVVDGALSAAAAGDASPMSGPIPVPVPSDGVLVDQPLTPVDATHPAPPVFEEPAAPVFEEAEPPVFEQPAPPVFDDEPVVPAPPVFDEPTPPVLDNPNQPAVEQPRTGSTDIWAPPTGSPVIPQQTTTALATRRNRGSSSIVFAGIGAGLLFLNAILFFAANNGAGLFVAGYIVQALAFGALLLHHATRPVRDGVMAMIGYIVALILSVLMAATSQSEDPYPYSTMDMILGFLLIAIGVWLLVSGRQTGNPFQRSLHAPGWFVIAAGLVDVISEAIWFSDGDAGFINQWIWPLSIIAMATGYALSAYKLNGEVRSSRVGVPAVAA